MGLPGMDETTGTLTSKCAPTSCQRAVQVTLICLSSSTVTLDMLGLPDNVMRSIGPCRRLERLDCTFQLYSPSSPSSACSQSQSQSQPSSLAQSQQHRRKDGTPLKQQMLACSEPEPHMSSLIFRTLLNAFGKLAAKYPLVFNTKHAEVRAAAVLLRVLV